MAQAPASAALQRFVDDEIVRAPLLADQMIDAALEHMQQALPGMMPQERAVAADLLARVLSHRQHIVDYYVRSLRGQVSDELQRRQPAMPSVPGPKLSLSLSLVDEGEVAVDVEISHTIEAIRSVAEYELRELQTFTSALVGDMDVSRDYNPFRAETHARALWAAAQALPLSRGFQLTFMRHASMALAQVLRKTYAGASSRLEAAGIEPASHRTLILPSGSRRQRPASNETTFNPDLLRIRDTMPVQLTELVARPPLEQLLAQADAELQSLPADAESNDYARLREQHRRRYVDSAATPVDQQLVELLSRLFDAILADHALAADVRLLLSRLQAPTLRVALRDPQTLDRISHPVWQFAEQVGFLGDILPAPGDEERERFMRFVQGLIDHLVSEDKQNAGLYQWAMERLEQHHQQRLEQRCAAAAEQIATLQKLEDKLCASQTAPTSMHGAIDVHQLDTVPADLIDVEPARKKAPESATAWLEKQRLGDWVRLFMQGRWVHAQLLWPGERGELFLFADAVSSTTWAVRRGALLMLLGENLLDSLEPRSLVRAAAKRVMRQAAR